MKILLLDNAIDFFECSLRHLRTFLQMDCKFEHPDTSTTYLKQAILYLNSALELFFKERISVINPLLIYEHISTDTLPQVIVDYYAKEENGEIDETLYNYVRIAIFISVNKRCSSTSRIFSSIKTRYSAYPASTATSSIIRTRCTT